jgi:hypothetical protein
MRAVPSKVLLALVVALALVAFLAMRTDSSPDAKEVGRAPVSADAETGYEVGSIPDGYDKAVATATKALPLALGYDYKSLKQGLNNATKLMTEDFGKEFRRTFRTSAAELAKNKQAVTSATVRAAGVVRVEGDHVDCLLYVDQVLVSSDTMKDKDSPVRVSQNRVLVGLTRSGNEWKVDSIKPF